MGQPVKTFLSKETGVTLCSDDTKDQQQEEEHYEDIYEHRYRVEDTVHQNLHVGYTVDSPQRSQNTDGSNSRNIFTKVENPDPTYAYHDEIQYVPRVAQVGMRLETESHCKDFEHHFDCE